jgi:hypothetical protein
VVKHLLHHRLILAQILTENQQIMAAVVVVVVEMSVI